MEPLIITKKHLLSFYEDFIFIFKEDETDNIITLANQNIKYDITAINEFALFPSNAKLIEGEDFALPIFTELLHEKTGHSKKEKKNKRSQSPLYFYKKSNLCKVEKEYQDPKEKKNIKGEAGLLVEYFIRYKKISLVSELKFNYSFGKILKNVNYFTSKNFELLYQEINISKNNKSIINIKRISSCFHFDEKQIKKVNNIINKSNKDKGENKRENTEQNNDLNLQNLEKKYLWQGKYFIYPDSIPYTVVPYNTKDYPVSKAKIEYFKKYKKEIENGRKLHYQ